MTSSLLLEAIKDANSKLKDTLQIGISADQRAISLGSIYIAAATTVLGALIALKANDVPTLTGSIFTSILFFVGAFLCLKSAFPVPIWTSGSTPDFWKYYIDKNLPLEEARVTQLDQLERKITENYNTLEANSKTFKIGAFIGLFSPIIGLIIYAVLLGC